MTTTIIIAIVLVAAVIAWTRTRRLQRRFDDGDELMAAEKPRKQPVEIWISLVAEDASKRDRIIDEIRRLGRIAPTASATDILIEAEDGEKAMNEIRATLSVLAARATVSITRAADGKVN
jgi:hypothetical protein